MENQSKYNELCDRLDAISHKYNPCQFENGKCIASRKGLLGEYSSCCRRCRHLGDNGCTERILGCKMWYCGEALSNLPALVWEEINYLKIEGFTSGFHMIIGEKQL